MYTDVHVRTCVCVHTNGVQGSTFGDTRVDNIVPAPSIQATVKSTQVQLAYNKITDCLCQMGIIVLAISCSQSFISDEWKF